MSHHTSPDVIKQEGSYFITLNSFKNTRNVSGTRHARIIINSIVHIIISFSVHHVYKYILNIISYLKINNF